MFGTKEAALILGLTSLAATEVQITQPAPRADTLAVQPEPLLRWVYTSSDPDLVGFVIRQVKTDSNYEPLLTITRGATPVSMGSITIPMSTVNWEEGMNVTIAITEVTEENQNQPLDQKVLASRGPLRLMQGSNDIEPMGSPNETSTAAAASTITDSSNGTAAVASSSTDTATSATAASPNNSEPSNTTPSTNDSAPEASSDVSAAAVATPSSDAERMDAITILYVITLIVTAIPAFWFGTK